MAIRFFLGIAILQFFGEFATISPGLVILPLLIVMSITAIKDGYEDIKRHQSDRHVNSTRVRILRGGNWVNTNAVAKKRRTSLLAMFSNLFAKRRRQSPGHEAEMGEAEPRASVGSMPASTIADVVNHHRDQKPHWGFTQWQDVRVGDFIKIVDNQSFPADILICSTSEDENVAFVETKNLDGETNLKSRHAVQELTFLRTAADCADKQNAFHIECDRPEFNMYKLNAAVVKDKDKYPVDFQMTLLRGTVLRNTAWVIGVVLFTGDDSKIVLNSGGTPSKRSKVERQMNPQVYVFCLFRAIL